MQSLFGVRAALISNSPTWTNVFWGWFLLSTIINMVTVRKGVVYNFDLICYMAASGKWCNVYHIPIWNSGTQSPSKKKQILMQVQHPYMEHPWANLTWPLCPPYKVRLPSSGFDPSPLWVGKIWWHSIGIGEKKRSSKQAHIISYNMIIWFCPKVRYLKIHWSIITFPMKFHL